ncbi:hypothetical protein [Chryseobacterium populi]|uniref:Uncharacterized protein n=1 Tax=Chryseobacterium populi TaxID=1144316 RepID=J2K313_9FLAO|nr:hypothetical protein [Chryseobacterium populi]EJL67658.1 hypothetical protein PMI13_04094 [Chryseobacterium populi]
MKKIVLSAVTMGIILSSCSNNDSDTPSTADQKASQSAMMKTNLFNLSLDDKRAYLESILMTSAKYIVLEAQKSAEARNVIYAELEKNIDGDDNALVDIFYQNIPALYTNPEFKNSLTTFNDLEGSKYFPQVFIYNYSGLKATGKTGTSNPILTVFYTGDETQTSAKAYALNSSGNWEFVKMVDEQTIENEEVWVFSLNETFVNTIDLSVLPKDVVPTAQKGPSAPPPDDRCQDGIHYWPYFEYMTIRKHNESFFAGKSDIWTKTYTAWDTPNSVNPCNSSLPKLMWTNNPSGEVFIRKFMRYMIPNTSLYVVCGYAGSWDPGPANANGWQGNAFNYVIFEKDSWPTGVRFTDINNNGFNASHQYRSADDYYDKGIILHWSSTGPHMNGYSRNISGQIKFNSRL